MKANDKTITIQTKKVTVGSSAFLKTIVVLDICSVNI